NNRGRRPALPCGPRRDRTHAPSGFSCPSRVDANLSGKSLAFPDAGRGRSVGLRDRLRAWLCRWVKGKLAASLLIRSRAPIRIHGEKPAIAGEHRRRAVVDRVIFAIPVKRVTALVGDSAPS